jgi:hypothetical protein
VPRVDRQVDNLVTPSAASPRLWDPSKALIASHGERARSTSVTSAPSVAAPLARVARGTGTQDHETRNRPRIRGLSERAGHARSRVI